MAAWTRAACRAYAGIVAAGRTDLTNPHAFAATVARQATVERAGRLAELYASGLDPASAAAALVADGPAPPLPPARRGTRPPLGDPTCPCCEGGGWTPDLAGLMVRCACTAPGLDLEPLPPPEPDDYAVEPDFDAGLAHIRAIRQGRVHTVGWAHAGEATLVGGGCVGAMADDDQEEVPLGAVEALARIAAIRAAVDRRHPRPLPPAQPPSGSEQPAPDRWEPLWDPRTDR